jgi:molecular chaperone DnaJ
MQLCLRSEGEPGDFGGPRGDLYCDIHVAEHALFQRHGHDLVCAVPISFSQAALGTEFDIPLLDGRHTLSIPAGTQPGDVIRLRNKGMPDPHSRRKGDLLVQVQVEVPRKLAPRQEELLRELAELEKKNVGQHQKSFFEKLKGYFSE